MQPLLLCFLFLLSQSHAEDTVAEDIGPHQLERLVGLLTARECEELISALTHVEENIFQRLERLSAERNRLTLNSRRRRNTDEEPSCRFALKEWLHGLTHLTHLTHGQQIYYDRLTRALQQIGRTDIAIEVGKNINQDKTLAMQKYVEGYHELVKKMAAQNEVHQSELEDHDEHEEVLQYSAKQGRGLTWKDVDLVVNRQPVSPSQNQLLDILWPLLYGLLLGFAGALLMNLSILLISIYVSHGNRTRSKAGHQHHHHPLFSHVTSSKRDPLKQLQCPNDTQGENERPTY